ncbi:DNA repair protein RecN [Caldalkalibacillus salinus]|uniref:DNA repair protein RecN n=1 Tax=Caldalkalibacillus salinus TaxID=2803787 RepID=UPI001923F0BD|nr:DNA repair protein RecN [Caldalkalibacillus salinus]
MLVEISIRNFAIISSVTVSFREGLHVLTGETGAGKSIILDAVSMLIGGRGSTEYVRHGANKAEIEGLFELPQNHPVNPLLEDMGIDLQDDDSLVLRRDISAQGKSVCRINGKLVTLAILREIGQLLVDIHSQNQHHQLLHEERYLEVIDGYGKDEIAKHKREYRTLYQEYKDVSHQVKRLLENERQTAQRLDLLRFQLDEIAAARLEPEEDEHLQQEKQKHAHSQKIFNGVSESYEVLQSDGGTIDSLGLVMSRLQDIAAYDSSIQPLSKIVEDVYYQLEEVILQLGRYRDDFSFHPDQLNEIENRLVEIDKLRKKYGSNVLEILEYAAQVEDELDTLEHKEERMDELYTRKAQLAMDLSVEAQHLTTIRSRICQRLEKEIQQELKGLHMDRSLVEIELIPAQTGEQVEHDGITRYLRQDGWDDVQIRIATNPGEPPKPLSKIASGGEMSRLMLALKTVLAKSEPVTTLIFDEVDTGVSGRVAQAMAERLYQISLDKQVLSITHHAQVAAMADQHYRIEKHQTKNNTRTTVLPLHTNERAEELAKINSGVEVTDVSLQHANELLQKATDIQAEIKEKLSN